jgi:hypothetical protein
VEVITGGGDSVLFRTTFDKGILNLKDIEEIKARVFPYELKVQGCLG